MSTGTNEQQAAAIFSKTIRKLATGERILNEISEHNVRKIQIGTLLPVGELKTPAVEIDRVLRKLVIERV
jgi:hypothetical protein